MTVENGNGEVRQLLEIKRTYRRNLTALEEELRANFERELADGKKRLKEQYLENVVDAVFAEPAPAQAQVEAKQPPPALVNKPKIETEPGPKGTGTVVLAKECPGCAAPVHPEDNFCSKCAAPLKEDEKPAESVVIAGRKFKPRRR